MAERKQSHNRDYCGVLGRHIELIMTQWDRRPVRFPIAFHFRNIFNCIWYPFHDDLSLFKALWLDKSWTAGHLTHWITHLSFCWPVSHCGWYFVFACILSLCIVTVYDIAETYFNNFSPISTCETTSHLLLFSGHISPQKDVLKTESHAPLSNRHVAWADDGDQRQLHPSWPG